MKKSWIKYPLMALVAGVMVTGHAKPSYAVPQAEPSPVKDVVWYIESVTGKLKSYSQDCKDQHTANIALGGKGCSLVANDPTGNPTKGTCWCFWGSDDRGPGNTAGASLF